MDDAAFAVNIKGVSKATLLQHLWNAASPAVFFAMRSVTPPAFDSPTADAAIAAGFIDYFCGRAIKCDLAGDTADPREYNEEHGAGKFEWVLHAMRHEAIGDEKRQLHVSERHWLEAQRREERTKFYTQAALACFQEAAVATGCVKARMLPSDTTKNESLLHVYPCPCDDDYTTNMDFDGDVLDNAFNLDHFKQEAINQLASYIGGLVVQKPQPF